MARETWNGHWQEGAFGRIRDFVGSTPAWYETLSPSDVAEDAYLLGIAGSLFLRDEDSGIRTQVRAGTVERRPPSPPAKPLGIPPFTYERCLAAGPEAAAAFASAASGVFGALHRECAAGSGSAEAWSEAIAALRRGGALRSEWPSDDRRCDPPLETFSEDIRACSSAVLRKSVHAFKIGFGLWGRWESP
jgi:hypothetical protein